MSLYQQWSTMGLNGATVSTGWVEEKRKLFMIGGKWHDGMEKVFAS